MQRMGTPAIAAILSIGTELTRGEIVNTNASWLAAELTGLGFTVRYSDGVDDDSARIGTALKRLASEAQVIVCTGGLGPTTDDLTTAAVALALAVPLERDASSVASIERRFASLGRTMTLNNLKQADFPRGAEVLENRKGSAPGFSVRIGQATAFFTPGVPSEMRHLFETHIRPRIEALSPRTQFQIRLHCFGETESRIGELMSGVEQDFPGVVLGYRPHFPEIELKVLAQADTVREAEQLARAAAAQVRKRLGDTIFAEGETNFIATTAAAVRARKATLALAESCTGGLLSQLLTKEPASDFYLGAVVCYANRAKEALLAVKPQTLLAHGAVSEETACEMALGVRTALGSDYALAITGIAGPTGGSEEKPLGLVYIALASPDGNVAAVKHNFRGDRERIQTYAAYRALDLLRSALLGKVT